MEVYQATGYVDFIETVLKGESDELPRGAVKSVATYLKCHPTFISQTLKGKANFNHEQAVRFCSYAKLTEEESEYFVDLLNRDRASTNEARAHFQRVIDRKLDERNNIQKRAGIKPSLSKENEIIYFQSWIHPLVHAALNLPHHGQIKTISKTLGLAKTQVQNSLDLLESIGLAQKTKDGWKIIKDVLHVGKDSPLNRNFHAGIRMKTSALLMEGARTSEHTHFSSIFCISNSDVKKLREVILNNLKDLRAEMVKSKPERIFTLSLDFYPSDAKPEVE